MKNVILALCLVAGLTACGDDGDKFTWGDASLQLSTDFCEALATCGYFGDNEDSPQKLAECTNHTNYHLCELEGSCDEELPEGSQDVSDACSVAMDEFISDEAGDGCYWLGYWGVVPEECGAVLDLNPKNTSEEE